MTLQHTHIRPELAEQIDQLVEDALLDTNLGILLRERFRESDKTESFGAVAAPGSRAHTAALFVIGIRVLEHVIAARPNLHDTIVSDLNGFLVCDGALQHPKLAALVPDSCLCGDTLKWLSRGGKPKN